jgi:spore maturation protein CgeB
MNQLILEKYFSYNFKEEIEKLKENIKNGKVIKNFIFGDYILDENQKIIIDKIEDNGKSIIIKYTGDYITDLWEMANFWPKDTGLPMIIWLQSKTGNEKHGCRIKILTKYGDKVSFSQGFFTITVPEGKIIGNTVEITTRDIKLVKKFIDKNIDIILQYWNGEISTGDFSSLIQTIHKD